MTMHDMWLERWQSGRTGWHETEGNAGLKAHWPYASAAVPGGHRVLVPLCGQSPDLLWLVARGHEVVGVELSDVAIRRLFAENDLQHTVDRVDDFDRYAATSAPLTVYCGDYLDFKDRPFNALYDRGALVAMPATARPAYVEHTESLLMADATRMVITLEYDQAVVDGPPFAVNEEEVRAYWPELRRISASDDIDHCPPKFRQAGLTRIDEVIWLS